MSRKLVLIVSVFALVFAFGAVNAFASGGSDPHQVYVPSNGTWTSAYTDGRLNAFDINQSVAVYYTYNTVMAWDANGVPYDTHVVSGLQLWAIDGDGVGQMVLNVPAAQLNAAVAAGHDAQIAASNGFTVNYSATGYFWISSPSGYTFTWAA